MKRITFALYLCTALIACTLLETMAATHVVLPNTSIQAKIDLAVAGDTIIIKGGTYSGEALTIGKLLDIRPAAGESVIIAEGVTLQNLNGIFNFANLRIGGDTSKYLTINNCTKVYLDNLNLSTSGGGLDIDNNSTVQVNNCTFGNSSTVDVNCTIYAVNSTFKAITLNNSKITLRKCTINGNINANKTNVRLLKTTVNGELVQNASTDDYGRSLDCTVFQCIITERLYSRAARSWVAYNTIRWSDFKGEVWITGNHFDGRNISGSYQNGILIDGASTVAKIYNNKIHKYGHDYGGGDNVDRNKAAIGIRVENNADVEIINNVIHDCNINSDRYSDYDDVGVGILIVSTSRALIKGNIIYDCWNANYSYGSNDRGRACVWAPAANVTLTYNNLRKAGSGGVRYAGGVVGVNNQEEIDPKLNGDYTLQVSSPCINAGPPEARYNDYGATRNDMGLFGGHRYDPNGATTTKPVVLSFDLTPTQLLKGTDTTITIKSRGAIITP